jgi:hypothetical protein
MIFPAENILLLLISWLGHLSFVSCWEGVDESASLFWDDDSSAK